MEMSEPWLLLAALLRLGRRDEGGRRGTPGVSAMRCGSRTSSCGAWGGGGTWNGMRFTPLTA